MQEQTQEWMEPENEINICKFYIKKCCKHELRGNNCNYPHPAICKKIYWKPCMLMRTRIHQLPHWEKNVGLIDYPGWVQHLPSQLSHVICRFLCSELTQKRKYLSSHASVKNAWLPTILERGLYDCPSGAPTTRIC